MDNEIKQIKLKISILASSQWLLAFENTISPLNRALPPRARYPGPVRSVTVKNIIKEEQLTLVCSDMLNDILLTLNSYRDARNKFLKNIDFVIIY